VTDTQFRCLEFLDHELGQAAASCVGAHLWPNRTGPIISSNGGGDYKAQMYLGRLKKRGWVYTPLSAGSSRWALTPKGVLAFRAERKRRERADPDSGARVVPGNKV